MVTRPIPTQLDVKTERIPTQIAVHCSGRVTSATAESLKTAVNPLFSQSKVVVLDFRNVSYIDSTGVGIIISLYRSAKAASSQLKLINLNKRLMEFFRLMKQLEHPKS